MTCITGALLGSLATLALVTPAGAAWPGGNGLIGYETNTAVLSGGSPQDARNWDVLGMNPDGSGKHALIATSNEYDGSIAWSPDGRELAAVSIPGADPLGPSSIRIHNADGSLIQTVVSASTALQDPSFSPDMNQIVYEQDANGTVGDIFVIGRDGSNPRQLTSSPLSDDAPVWSPDGTKILYTGLVPGKGGDPREILTMNVDGSGKRRITKNKVTDTAPEWSPDGTEIVFVSKQGGKDLETYTVSANGSHLQRLTRNRGWDFEPAFSPDGRWIVQQSYRRNVFGDGSAEIFLMKADGSRRRALTANLVDDESPDWQPSGVECVQVIYGTGKGDTLRTPSTAARLLGFAGRDSLIGGTGGDCLMGASGNDQLRGLGGRDALAGGFGGDRLRGGSGSDYIWGGPGNDRIDARDHERDVIDCGWDTDRVIADRKDRLRRCEQVRR